MSLLELVEAMPAERKAGALAVLDHLSRPLTQAEIAAHLRRHGVSNARAAKIAAATKDLHIIALVGDGANS